MSMEAELFGITIMMLSVGGKLPTVAIGIGNTPIVQLPIVAVHPARRFVPGFVIVVVVLPVVGIKLVVRFPEERLREIG